jgi:hypothetical protein
MNRKNKINPDSFLYKTEHQQKEPRHITKFIPYRSVQTNIKH